MIVSTQPEYGIEYVDSPSSLEGLLAKLDRVDTVYFDLEADSMHHYYAKICLIQILVDDRCYLVDPLSGINLNAFLDKLATKVMVMHGADYDLRMLYQSSGFRPKRIFDTMLAAQLLGKPGFGLAALVQSYFGIALRKDQQKADWSQRPLPPLMLEYGAQDTFFLPGLYQALTRELEEKNRLSWHEECCRELIKATANIKEVDLENAWRIDGSSKLHSRQLAVLQKLWRYRDDAAKAQDLPSYKVLPSDLLIRFALAVPHEGEPPLLPNLPSRLNPKFKSGFLDAFHEALSLPPESWPQPLKATRRVTPSPSAPLLAQLRQVRDRLAKDLGLDPSLLATKNTLTHVALTGCTSRTKMIAAAKWMKWQEDLLLESWVVNKDKPFERGQLERSAEKSVERSQGIPLQVQPESPKPPPVGPPKRAWGRR